jgi:hypothetical protein
MDNNQNDMTDKLIKIEDETNLILDDKSNKFASIPKLNLR